ncbi:hypothetical protein [Nonomuraea sp. NPDC005501]|uniref:hypothetical protein n=1 Tax=Nonomuraea sp. NPDC005501 TaxID=3156884 RepID=UPI0033A3608F
MSGGWVLGSGLADRVARIPGEYLAVVAGDLGRCVYPLRAGDGRWTVQALPLWSSALYVALGQGRHCLYTGIVQRGTREQPDMRGLRERTAEHYRNNQPYQMRATWWYLWVIPLHHGVLREDLETWETTGRRATACPQTRKSRLLRAVS